VHARRKAMATANVLNEKGYLLEVYRELEDIKERINRLRGREGTVFMTHERHLLEIADYIDWKLQILEKGTGFDWKAAGEKDVESIVSVRSPELGTGPDFSGGYVGG